MRFLPFHAAVLPLLLWSSATAYHVRPLPAIDGTHDARSVKSRERSPLHERDDNADGIHETNPGGSGEHGTRYTT